MTCPPLVTTIIPTYRRPHLLKGAILSVLNQTMSEIQVCVYDNASGDETAKVVEEIAKIDPRLKYYCHSHPIDPADNFQFGIASVKTPFFSLLADDDLLAPNFYEIAVSAMNRFPDCSFFLGSTLDVKANGKVVSANALQWEETKIYEPPFGLYHAIGNYFNWTGALFRQQVLKQVRIDSTVKPIDLDFILRLAAQFRFVVSKQPCALFVHYKKSYSSYCGIKLVWPSWLKIVENIESVESLTLSQKKDAKELLFLKLQQNLFSIAIGLTSTKQFQQASQALAVFLNEFPGHRGSKILSLILPYIERYSGIYWIFHLALGLYRIAKRLPLQFKYGRFSKNLIFKFRRYTAPTHLE
jgi:glycosyltransferase involved in cell wall biosynthesis